MLTKARNKGVYHELVKAELTAYLGATSQRWDAIVCADTLCYFGALDEVVVAARDALRPGGQFLFTVEACTGPAPAAGYSLAQHGRYSHTRPYLESVLAAAGLGAEFVAAELRMESGVPVAGCAVRASLETGRTAALYSAAASPGGEGPSRAMGAPDV
jgi:predicted TPR repeat methyltransferase